MTPPILSKEWQQLFDAMMLSLRKYDCHFVQHVEDHDDVSMCGEPYLDWGVLSANPRIWIEPCPVCAELDECDIAL